MPFFWKEAEKRNFNVMIYEEDYKELCAWVLKKPNIETGGDLFGLWADKHTAVIQLVLGPGKQCTRTTASFYQDIDYLRRVGSYLTQNEGVCHIGEWHSHHQLGLARPSGGDENTVWNNMPTYNLKRFVIFIANIQSSKSSYNVNVGCFLFEIDDQGKHMDVLPGNFTILEKHNPLSKKSEVTEQRKSGAEKDDQNKIAIKELKMEMNGGGKRPSVTYVKSIPDPSERKRGSRGNHSQLENQNTPNDEESSVDSKKRKMNTKERSLNKTPGNGKKSREGSPLSEDLENLTIDKEQPEEKSEEPMEQEQEKEQPVKNSQEEIKHEEEHDDESGKSQGNKAGKIEKNNEDSPPQAEQGKTENEGKQRPLPKLPGTETTPEAKTQKQKEDEEQPANRRAATHSGATTEEKREGSPLSEDLENLTIDNEQPEEISEEPMEQEQVMGQPAENSQEEIKHEEQHDGESGTSQGEKAGKIDKNNQSSSSHKAEKGKTENEGKQRPLPELPGTETTPEAKTQKQKEDEEQAEDEEETANRRRSTQSGATTEETPDSKEHPSQGSNKTGRKEEETSQETSKEQEDKELQDNKNQEGVRPDEQHNGEERKSSKGGKEENDKKKAGSPQAEEGKAKKGSKPIVLLTLGKETKPAVKTPKDKEMP